MDDAENVILTLILAVLLVVAFFLFLSYISLSETTEEPSSSHVGGGLGAVTITPTPQPTSSPAPSSIMAPPEITVTDTNGAAINSIQWGTIAPGENRTRLIYLNSTQNFNAVSASIQNPNPATLTSYMNLIVQSQPLQAYTATPLNLTLTVSPSIQNIMDFSFQIVLAAS